MPHNYIVGSKSFYGSKPLVDKLKIVVDSGTMDI